MHELSIALSILDCAAEEAERQSLDRVVAIHLRLGPLAGVVKESLLSAYELAREGSGMDDSELIVEEMPITMDCPSCGGEQAVVSIHQLCCARCGTPALEVLHGRELEISALEVEA